MPKQITTFTRTTVFDPDEMEENKTEIFLRYCDHLLEFFSYKFSTIDGTRTLICNFIENWFVVRDSDPLSGGTETAYKDGTMVIKRDLWTKNPTETRYESSIKTIFDGFTEQGFHCDFFTREPARYDHPTLRFTFNPVWYQTDDNFRESRHNKDYVEESYSRYINVKPAQKRH